jgi:multidrug efflux pump subunit AcrB
VSSHSESSFANDSAAFIMRFVGEDFFPPVDAGLLKLHVRAPSGTRIERTAWLVDNIERSIRKIIPADELEQISDDIDLPQPYAIAFFSH